MRPVENRRQVGVFPAPERARRRRLFDVLEQAFPVCFQARQPGELRNLDAVVEVGGCSDAAAAQPGVPALSLREPEPLPQRLDTPTEFALSRSAALDPVLRGAVLRDAALTGGDNAPSDHPGPLNHPRGPAAVLAHVSGKPIWARAGTLHQAILAPSELGLGEALRERLCEGRCAALLPLVHLLAEITRDIRWRPPAARASFLIDDPNLHWPTYGFLRLPELAEHARGGGYHVALATIPLDSWFAHPAAVRVLREHNDAVSLLVHGNDHRGAELGLPQTEGTAVALAAQALRRVEGFERRTRIRIDRIMAPPHEACSEGSVRALLRCGFEAMSMTRPFPWRSDESGSWLSRPEGVDALVGWRAADLVAGGLPVMLRHPITQRSPSEIALRAFLGHPLILYGHHGDLADGSGILDEAAAEVNARRPASWCSLAEIAAGNFESRREGSRLRARPLSRRIRLEVPSDVDELTVELPAWHGQREHERLLANGEAIAPEAPIAVEPGTTVEFSLERTDSVDPGSVLPPRRRPLSVARRAAGECRDRMQPLLERIR